MPDPPGTSASGDVSGGDIFDRLMPDKPDIFDRLMPDKPAKTVAKTGDIFDRLMPDPPKKKQPYISPLDYLAGKAPGNSALEDLTEFMTGGHIVFGKEPAPEIQATPAGQITKNIPGSADPGMFNDPLTWAAFAATAPAMPLIKSGNKLVGKVVNKAAGAVREFVGQATGGATDIAGMATKGPRKYVGNLLDPPATFSKFDPLIQSAASKYGVDPNLIFRMIKHESNFNPKAISPVGAKGLMQLMPDTAADLGVRNVFDPEENLDAGVRYISQLLNKYDGDVNKALAAYNWGPRRVDKHGIDNLPNETSNYLRKILGGEELFRQGNPRGKWWTPDKEYAYSFGKTGKQVVSKNAPENLNLIDEEDLLKQFTPEERSMLNGSRSDEQVYDTVLDRSGYDGFKRLEEQMNGPDTWSYYIKNPDNLIAQVKGGMVGDLPKYNVGKGIDDTEVLYSQSAPRSSKATPSPDPVEDVFADLGGFNSPRTPEEVAEYASRHRSMVEMPEMVEMTRTLTSGENVGVFTQLRNKLAQGSFNPRTGKIQLIADIFKNPEEAAKVFSHEIGHLVDFLPDATLQRGNILGRIASLKKYMGQFLEAYKGAPGRMLTNADRARLMSEAEALAKQGSEPTIETIYREVPLFKTTGVDPEVILDLMRGVKPREVAPEIFEHLQKVDGKTKAAIIRQAMKGLVDEQLAKFGQKIQVGVERIKETITRPGKTVTKEEINRRFNELLSEEVKLRQLFDQETITRELKELSGIWKPFDPAANAKYTAYRHSSHELYADAFSVLMNNPTLLRNKAPNFYKAFFNWIDQKPEVKGIYDEIQRRLLDEEALLFSRANTTNAMFQRGNEAIAAKLKEQEKITLSGVLQEIKKALIDVNTPLIQKFKEAVKGGAKFEDVNNPRYWTEELPYISSKIAGYVQDIDNNIMKPLKDVGVSLDDFGSYLLHRRAATERAGMANPGGFGGTISARQVHFLKQQLGEEKFNALEKAAEEFSRQRQQVIKALEESGMYDDKLLNYIKNNDNYVTFSVVDYLEKEYGRGIAGHIYHQQGTLKDIANPFIATLMKDMGLIRAAEMTQAKKSVTKMFVESFPDEIRLADTQWNGKYHAPIPSANRAEELVVFLEKGKPSAFYLPKEIADTFNKQPYEAKMLMKAWQTIMTPLRSVLVSHNPLWMVANLVKDGLGTVTNIHGMTVPKLLRYYKSSLKEAWVDAMRGEPVEIVSEMLKNKMLVIDRQFDFRDLPSGDSALDSMVVDRILQSYGVTEKSFHNKVVQPFVTFWNTLGKFGKFTERLGKISGYKYLKDQGTDTKKAAHVVRSAIGTPDIYRRGSLHNITNSIFLFSNVGKEGFRSSWEAAKLHPGAYTWKLLKYNIAPKFVYKAAKYGLLGAGIAEICSKIPSYDEENYTIVPIGMTESGKAVYFTIPQSYTGQIVSGLMWNILDGKIMGKGGALDFTSGSQPYSINPYLSVASDLTTYYLRGRNPYDAFRGANVMSDVEFAAGGTDAAKALGRQTWSEMGGGSIYKPTSPMEKQGMTIEEKALKAFPLNIVGKFIKISNRGERESYDRLAREVESQEAKNYLTVKRRIIDGINKTSGKFDAQEMKSAYRELRDSGALNRSVSVSDFRTKYLRYSAKSKDIAVFDSVSLAKTNLQKARILMEYQTAVTPREFEQSKREMINDKLISAETLKTMKQLKRMQ